MRKSLYTPVLIAILALGLTAGFSVSQAWAKNGRGNAAQHTQAQKVKDERNDKAEDRQTERTVRDVVDVLIGARDRDAIGGYMRKHYQRDCPPGLAKKNNGCLPPGQAKKYAVGGTLQDGIWHNLPRDLADILSPAPRGHRYVQVDQDVLLVNEANKRILDAVTLLSATR